MNYKKISTWIIIIGILIIAIVYGISFLSLSEKLAFKELSRGQAELELQPEKDRLKSFADKVNNGEMLTEKEKRQAMKDSETIETVRKDYSKGELVPPPKTSFRQTKRGMGLDI